MTFTPLVTAFRDSREVRTPLETGERVASIEHDLGDDGPANMRPGRPRGLRNVFADLFAPDGDEPEVQA